MLQSTFCVNSLAHAIGNPVYGADVSARDSVVTAMVTPGEGYHSFHHRFPFDYRNAVRWWQYDPGKWLIWSLSQVGLASKIQHASDTIRRTAGGTCAQSEGAPSSEGRTAAAEYTSHRRRRALSWQDVAFESAPPSRSSSPVARDAGRSPGRRAWRLIEAPLGCVPRVLVLAFRPHEVSDRYGSSPCSSRITMARRSERGVSSAPRSLHGQYGSC